MFLRKIFVIRCYFQKNALFAHRIRPTDGNNEGRQYKARDSEMGILEGWL